MSATDAVAKVEMILLPGNSHYYWCDVRELTYYYGPELFNNALEEYEFQLSRWKYKNYESLTYYEKDANGRWKIINKKTI